MAYHHGHKQHNIAPYAVKIKEKKHCGGFTIKPGNSTSKRAWYIKEVIFPGPVGYDKSSLCCLDAEIT